MSASLQSASRQRLLNAADALFYTKGYGATGINRIIDDAGVAKATFYAHFSSKEALALAFLEKRHLAWFEHLEAHVERAKTPSTKALAPFTFLKWRMRESHYRGCVFLNFNGERELPDELLAAVKDHKEQTRELFVRLSKDLTNKRARHLAHHLFLLFEGAIVESQVHKSSWPIDAAKRAAKDTLQFYTKAKA